MPDRCLGSKSGRKTATRTPYRSSTFKVIDEWCNRIAAHDEGWANYFRENQIEPLILFYEDVVASHRATAERVLEFLRLPIPPEYGNPPTSR